MTEHKRNEFTVFLKEKRYMSLANLANKLELSTSSLRNTVYGIKPVKKVVIVLKQDEELFNLLPQVSQDILNNTTTAEDKKAS